MDTRSAEKKERLLRALDQGMAMIHVDARRPGVLVPPNLRTLAHLRLNLSYHFDPPDLSVGDWGIRSTLSFSSSRFTVAVPWSAFFAITSHATREFWTYPDDMPEEIRRQVAAAPPSPQPPEPRPSAALEWMRSNAFRVLGLPGNAPLSAIHEADAAMRRSAKLGIACATRWDLEVAGPVGRGGAEIRDALARLLDPARRLRERFLWVHEGEAVATTAGGARGHDAAFFKLVAACACDPNVSDGERWAGVLAEWKACIDDDRYWSAMIDAELAGGFEPMADARDVEDLRAEAATLIAEIPSAIARAALASGQGPVAAAALGALGASRLSTPDAGPKERLLGPLVENVERLCAQIAGGCYEQVQRVDTAEAVFANLLPCNAAMTRFDDQVQPALTEIERLAGADTDMGTEAREAAASCLLSIAMSYTWAETIGHTGTVLRRAAAIADGLPLHARIAAELSQAEEQARRLGDRPHDPPDLPSWAQSTKHPFFGRTVIYYEPQHGNQIEYVDEIGWAHLWYPGNKIVVRSEWRASQSHVWGRFVQPTYNPVTRQKGGQWERQSTAQVDRSLVQVVDGDVFNLASGRVPHVLPRHPRYGTAEEVLERIRAEDDRARGPRRAPPAPPNEAAPLRGQRPALRQGDALGVVDVSGTKLIIRRDEICFGDKKIATGRIQAARLGIQEHHARGIRTVQSAAIWLSDGTWEGSLCIECASGFPAPGHVVEGRWRMALGYINPAVIVPLLDRHVELLRSGGDFEIGDLRFDRHGIHRTGTAPGLKRPWTSFFSGREAPPEHLRVLWEEVSCQLSDGTVTLFSGGRPWASLSVRDTWNAVLIQPLVETLLKKGRSWDTARRSVN